MDRRAMGGWIVLGLFVIGIAVRGNVFRGPADRPPGRADQANAEAAELEAFLQKAKVVSVRKGAEGGRGSAWRIGLDDGAATRLGFFKYVDIRRPKISPISYKYELAAYRLTKLLAVPVMPPTIEKTVEGRNGSLQIYLQDCISENGRRLLKTLNPPDPKAFDNALEEINVLENLTASERDPKDILIHRSSWRVCRVDFAEAFDPEPELLPGIAITRCSRRLYQGLSALTRPDAEAALKPYLNDQEIGGLFARRALILKALNALIASKGDAAVLFDIDPKPMSNPKK